MIVPHRATAMRADADALARGGAIRAAIEVRASRDAFVRETRESRSMIIHSFNASKNVGIGGRIDRETDRTRVRRRRAMDGRKGRRARVPVTRSIERNVDWVGDARGMIDDGERMMDREDNDEIFREGGERRTDGATRTEGCVRERARERED